MSARLVGALAVTGLGAVAIFEAWAYGPGDLGRIGPGFFPLVVGVVLVACGVGLMRSREEEGNGGVPGPGPPALFVVGSLVWFAVAVRGLGIFPAVAGSVFAASLAAGRPGLSTVLLAIGVAAGAAILFVYGLGLPIPVLAW